MSIKPYKHQKQTLALRDKTPIIADLSEPGTGKTLAHLFHFVKHARRSGKAGIIVAPLSLVSTVWPIDAQRLDPTLRVSIAEAANREEAFKRDADLYVTNYNAYTWLRTQKKQFWDRFDWFLLDEATAVKNPTAQRTKAFFDVAKQCDYRAVLSGSLGAKSILDFWAPIFMLDRGKRLGPIYTQYRFATCVPTQVGNNVNAIKWMDRVGAYDAVMAQIADISIRHELEKCVDMPEQVIVRLPIRLPTKLMNYYNQMARDSILALQNKKINAVNAAVLHGKLRQVASGSVYDDEREIETLDTQRTELAMDLAEERGAGTIIFFRWGHQKAQLIAEAQRRGLTCAVIDGDSGSATARQKVVLDYQDGKIDTLFLQEQAAAHGLTLTRGTTTIWLSPTSVYDTFKQGNHRQFRNGQTRRCEVIVIVAENTSDEDAFEVCLGRKSNMDMMYDIFNRYTT